MIEFKKCFDLTGSITAFISRRRQEHGVSDAGSISPRVLTQEKDGSIIYSWNDFDPPNKKSGSLVTHVGLVNPATQEHKVIQVNNQKLKIVSCSVNASKTLLAFTTLSKGDVSKDGKTGREMYQAYLAELQASDYRVFSLNLERRSFLKVQFLYSSHSDQSAPRESHLLVFLHKESIGLYKIPMARAGDKRTVMSDQPQTMQLVRKFVWCQWDAVNQRLHYIYNYRPQGDNSSAVAQKLSTLQFHKNADHDSMLDIPLKFPFPYIRSTLRSHYADRPLNPGIPDVSLNTCVLSQANGTYCLCHQHMTFTSSKGKASPTAAADDNTIKYYISMVHHTKVLHGCVTGLPRSLIGSRRLSFHWIGELKKLLPGILCPSAQCQTDCGIEFEPCHHILLHNHGRDRSMSTSSTASFMTSDPELDPAHSNVSASDTEGTDIRPDTRTHTVRFQLVDTMTPTEVRCVSQASLPSRTLDMPDTMSVTSHQCRNIHSLSPCRTFTREIGGSVYDYRNGQVWKVCVSLEGLVESFKTAYAPTRQALLHYLLIRTKDLYTVKQIFSDICQDLTKTELTQSIAEYLVASTYSSMKRQLEKEVLRFLPFTAADTLRGQFERSPTGERLACLSYTSFDSINISTKTAREREGQQPVSEDMWDILRRRLRMRQLDHATHFNLDIISKKFSKLTSDEERDRVKWERVIKPSKETFLGSIHRTNRSTPVQVSNGGRLSRTEMVLGPQPVFLQGAYGEDGSRTRQLSAVTEELLTSYLVRHLKKDNKVKAHNVAKEYVACQVQKTQQLCHLLWSLRRTESSGCDNMLPNLILGFQTYFTALGFRCLHLRLFLQYVDRGVLSLTGQFVTQLLADVPDSDEDKENSEIKFQIISRLPKTLAEECFRLWNHPLCARYFAYQQVTEILLDGAKFAKSEDTREARDNDSIASGSSGYMAFPPLEIFIRHLKDTTKGSMKRHGRSVTESVGIIDVDTVLLEEVGLQHSKSSTQYDMSTVNF
ncbi:gamma-secretase-activating protein-like [Haliotis rubra]|uniref:gamma-secretase-activating protein-like n=1 Tax=Haliotis rubra TaxID=36100 RepID=UPI001EE5F684|nr:gamma-secretase-activating protein-like [Haliotis rubra]